MKRVIEDKWIGNKFGEYKVFGMYDKICGMDMKWGSEVNFYIEFRSVSI